MVNAAAAKKKATDDAEAAAAAAALAWPTGRCDLFIPRLLILVLVVYVLLIDGSALCSVRASMLWYSYEMHTFYAMLTVYSWISIIEKVLIFPTIQKTYYRQLTPSGFATSMRPPMFEGIHYKRWRVRAVLLFQTISCYDATLGKPEGELDAQQAQAF